MGKSMTGWNGSLQQVHLTHPRCACGGLNQHRFPRGISVWAKSLFSITQSCLTLCDHMDCSTPGLPVLHYLLEFAQTHVHWVDDAILCCPLLVLPSIFPRIRVFSSESALCISGQSIGASASASVLPMNIQCWFLLRLTGLISLMFKGLSRVFSNTTIQKHKFLGAQPSLWSNSHMTTGKTIALSMWTVVGKVISLLF